MPALCRVQGIAEDLDREDSEVHIAGDREGGVRAKHKDVVRGRYTHLQKQL
jgi:hypothetical protein